MLESPKPCCMLSMCWSFPSHAEKTHVVELRRHPVGIYPEVKHPSWHDSRALSCMANTTITEKVMQARACYISTTVTGRGCEDWHLCKSACHVAPSTMVQCLAVATHRALALRVPSISVCSCFCSCFCSIVQGPAVAKPGFYSPPMTTHGCCTRVSWALQGKRCLRSVLGRCCMKTGTPTPWDPPGGCASLPSSSPLRCLHCQLGAAPRRSNNLRRTALTEQKPSPVCYPLLCCSPVLSSNKKAPNK